MQRTLRAGLLRTNVQFRQATFIETSISNVERVLLEAAVVVALVLFIFLMNARATFVSLDGHSDIDPGDRAGLSTPSASPSTP